MVGCRPAMKVQIQHCIDDNTICVRNHIIFTYIVTNILYSYILMYTGTYSIWDTVHAAAAQYTLIFLVRQANLPL